MAFRDRYIKAKTLGELDTIIETELTASERKKLMVALETVEEYLDITFRDKAVLRALRHYVKQDEIALTDSDINRFFKVN
jgi:hypothetical protein